MSMTDLFPDEQEREQLRELYQLINRLGELERALILLWLDDRSYEEIAEMLDISVSNVGVRINRIKAKLKQMSNN
jgi:RNA polymerase sigma-70 factor (ECF subfamily)